MQLNEKNNFTLKEVFSFKKRKNGYSKPIIAAIRKVIPKYVKHKINQNRILKRYYDRLRRVIIKPIKSPRVYIKEGISRMEFFEILHERKVEYVLLRWWHNLPEIPEGEDMDILIKDEHRDLLNDLIVFYDNGTDLKCDLYTIAGSKHGSRRNIPYFQSNLAHTLIEKRIFYKGAYVPSPMSYFASLAYHAVFHKGFNSGLPGFKEKPIDVEHDYTSVLKDLSIGLVLTIDITVQGIYIWLKEQNFAPADDTLSKLVELKPELNFLQKRLYSDSRGGDLIVYIVREKLLKDGLLDNFKNFLEDKYQFDIIDIRKLNAEEKIKCKTQIRGGKWDKGPYKSSGGPPVALIVAYDYYPWPIDSVEAKKQPRMTNRNNPNAKYDFRDIVNSSTKINAKYNGVHSSDNELDSWFYISQIGEAYRKKISKEVEIRRKHFAGIWSVEKTLSTGPISKVEIIKYGEGLAVKKTFRPGKEAYFRRELFAVKELSKELTFIPPLLEEGEGYLVIPYFENILNEIPELEKNKILASKRIEILKVIESMHTRGLAFVNFTPESLIITPDNKLYCTGFSFLQKYKIPLSNTEKGYEFTDIAKECNFDLPKNIDTCIYSFNNVWKPYIGNWTKNALDKVN